MKKLLCEMAVPFRGSFQVEFALSRRVFHFRLRSFMGSFLRNLLCTCMAAEKVAWGWGGPDFVCQPGRIRSGRGKW